MSAHSWSIMDAETGSFLWGKDEGETKEMASLTKVMTAVVVSKMLPLMKIDPQKYYLKISHKAANMPGTSASLKENHKLTIFDLLHGLLLPSGNDAAVALAEGVGALILQYSKKKLASKRLKTEITLPGVREDPDPYLFFIRVMNQIGKKLGLAKSHFTNPHGLSDKGNHSSAAELGRLAGIAKKIDLINNIVGLESYRTSTAVDENGEEKIYKWSNTNIPILREEGFDGFKTGITQTAGPCLIGSYHKNDVSIIITLLNSRTIQYRHREMVSLAHWAISKIQFLMQSFHISKMRKLSLYCKSF